MTTPDKDPYAIYVRDEGVSEKVLGYAWDTAIGLQAVDDLTPSSYLKEIAAQSIDGKITIQQAQELIDSYYRENRRRERGRDAEADKVSVRIAAILSERGFTFSPAQYIGIHRRLFDGIYPHAGKIRDYNITKKEWVLDGDTVTYGLASELFATLEYDMQQEKSFTYRGLDKSQIIRHLALFISRLWQIHIFGEGNTRTTAVFFIKYLRTLGFDAQNDTFSQNAWYFRNAMVRANYTNIQKNIYATTEYLEMFLRNLLFGEAVELRNRELHIAHEKGTS